MIKLIIYGFLTSAIVFAILSLVFAKQTLDINLHDSYFIVSWHYLLILNAVLAALTGIIYYLFFRFYKPLGLNLGIIHYMFVLMSIITLSYAVNITTQPINYTSSYNQIIVRSTEVLLIAVAFFIAGHFLFLINIIRTLLKRKVSE